MAGGAGFDLICLSHLRWDFVWQRPQHLMCRAAQERRVFFVEEPLPGEGGPRLDLHDRDGVTVAVPRLPEGTPVEEAERVQARLLEELVDDQGIRDHVLW